MPAGRKRKSHAAEDPAGADVDEKRIKFLERNRAAATRCREKKKLWMLELEQKATHLTAANAQIKGEIRDLFDEVSKLKAFLASQVRRGVAGPGQAAALSRLCVRTVRYRMQGKVVPALSPELQQLLAQPPLTAAVLAASAQAP